MTSSPSRPVAPEISVAISTRGRPESLLRCLRAIADGDLLPREVVVVDQSDVPLEAQRRTDPRWSQLPIRWVEQGAVGLGVSQNEAFRRSSAPIVAVTDDDCVPHRTWISVLARTFSVEPAPDLVTGRILPLPAEGDRTYAVATRVSERRRRMWWHDAPWRVGSGNNFAVRREWFDRVGGCDDLLGPGAPGQGALDVDLFYRLLRARAEVLYEPSSLVFHERQTREGRLSRRFPYGFGTGAFLASWLSRGDYWILWLFVRWLAFRLREAATAVARRDFERIREEWIVLSATFRGFAWGFRKPPRARAAGK